jgi:hypothetical protein
MLMSTELNRPVRTGASFDADDQKSRVARGRNIKSVKL